MKAPVSKLLEISSTGLGKAAAAALGGLDGAENLVEELSDLLANRNGFFAFESALHVYPSDRAALDDIVRWNAADTWRSAYSGLADGALFFAEDVFGEQFCIMPGGVFRFEPETAERKLFAVDLKGWADRILKGYPEETGWVLAHDWQLINGPLPRGVRLVPRVPFVLGGDYALENLLPVESWRAMRYRGNLARTIHHTPDGQAVSYVPIDIALRSSAAT